VTSRGIKHDVACVEPVDANCSSHLALPCCCACGGTHMLCALPMQDAVKAVQDKPLEKIQGVISRAMVELPDSVPAPLGALYTNMHIVSAGKCLSLVMPYKTRRKSGAPGQSLSIHEHVALV